LLLHYSADAHRQLYSFPTRRSSALNLERMIAAEHIRLHNAESYGDEFDPEAHGEAIRDALARRALDPQWRSNFSRVQSERARDLDRKSTRLNSSHVEISYAVFCLKK